AAPPPPAPPTTLGTVPAIPPPLQPQTPDTAPTPPVPFQTPTAGQPANANTLVFGGNAPTQQAAEGLQVSVITAAVSTTVATSTATTASVAGGESLATQSFSISAKDTSGNGEVQLAVEQGLPQWMRVEAVGDGTMTLKGDRPEGDETTYKVLVKVKRADGEEVTIVVTVAPEGKAIKPQGDEDGNAPDEATPDENQQTSNEWLGQFLAELTEGQGQYINILDGESENSFSAQLESESLERAAWLKNMAA
ncbi:MAG: hypothetical protein JKY68_00175, partial [Rhodospirillales bacterium]|nr:hypothetical protein [Rhodospirillales bacterium]